MLPLTDKVGSNSFFSPSGLGFNGFPLWHLYCLASCPRHTQDFFNLKYLSFCLPLFSFHLTWLLLSLHLGEVLGNVRMLTAYTHADLFIGLRRGDTSTLGFLIIPLLAWTPETLHNWQTCKSIACVKIAGWAWEPDKARVTSATVWLNQCEPCVVSTFQGLDNEKHTVYSLSCCLHSWLVWSQDFGNEASAAQMQKKNWAKWA